MSNARLAMLLSVFGVVTLGVACGNDDEQPSNPSSGSDSNHLVIDCFSGVGTAVP